ncbi:MAG: hypothetical protein RLZZ262_2537 [Bacteroidota bacterium]
MPKHEDTRSTSESHATPDVACNIHVLKRTSVLFSCDGSFLGASFFCEWPFYGAFFFYRKALSDVFNFLLISIIYC